MAKYLLILIILVSTAAAATENKIAFLKGKAWINGKQANSKQVIQYGDSIKTGKDSLAVLIVQPGATLKLKSNSEMIIKKPRISKTINSQSFILKTGEAFVKAQKTKTNRYFVKSKNATFGVRGTQFFVSAIKKDNVWMCVNEGSVAVKTQASKKYIVVNAGEGVVIDSPKLPKARRYTWTKNLNWKMNGSYNEIKDSTIIENLDYDIENFDYD